MPKIITEQQKSKIKELRAKGLTTRVIAERLKIAPATAFYYSRHVKTDTKSHENSHNIENLGTAQPPMAALAHLGFTYVCPYCGEEQKHVYLCLDCRVFVCVSCGKVIDLKKVPRKEELSFI